MLMRRDGMPEALTDVLTTLVSMWKLLKNHIDEVFFGDLRGAAVVLNAGLNIPGNPYTLAETVFGELPRVVIEGPTSLTTEEIYGLMRALAHSA